VIRIFVLFIVFSGKLLAGNFWMSLPQDNKIVVVWYDKDSSLLPPELFVYANCALDEFEIISHKQIPGLYRFIISNLTPNCRYTLDIFRDQSLLYQTQFLNIDDRPSSYNMVVGACSFLPGNQVFKHLRAFNPTFYLSLGDIHYGDVNSFDYSKHLSMMFSRIFDYSEEANFFRNTPMAHIWDDHDFCGNDSEGPSECALAAKKAYRMGVPFHKLAIVEDGLHQKYSLGRVSFVIPDLRSNRTSNSLLTDVAKKWIKESIIEVAEKKSFLVLVSSVPWLGSSRDSWGRNSDDKNFILGLLDSLLPGKCVIICGDAHMAGIDTGKNNMYSPRERKGPPVIQVAALLGFGSHKGGIYSSGDFPNPIGAMQYAQIKVMDSGHNALIVKITLHRISTEGKEQLLGSILLPVLTEGSSIDYEEMSKIPGKLQVTLWSREGKMKYRGPLLSEVNRIHSFKNHFIEIASHDRTFYYAL
jgi:hypothetical protein